MILDCLRWEGPWTPAGASFERHGQVDWEEVCRLAGWYGVAPIVYARLAGASSERSSFRPPEAILARFQKASHSSLVWNLHLRSELQRLLDEFPKSGIEVVLLKGLYLAETFYGNIGLRPSADLDLLVRPEDLDSARDLLVKLGYGLKRDEPWEVQLEEDFHAPFEDPESGVEVELHWHIARKGHLGRVAVTDPRLVRRWWDRCRTDTVAGRQVRVLDPTDLILQLSLHFLKHRLGHNRNFTSQGALLQLTDIALVLKHEQDCIDWAELCEVCEEHRVLESVALVLSLVGEIFEGETAIRRALETFKTGVPPVNKELLVLAVRRILSREDLVPICSTGFKDSLQSTFRKFFPERALMAQRYCLAPDSRRLYFYYLLRPFQLLSRYGRLAVELPRLREDMLLNRWIRGEDFPSGDGGGIPILGGFSPTSAESRSRPSS